MSFWQIILTLVGTVWVFMAGVAIFGAGIPLLRAKRKERRNRDQS